MTAVEWLIEQCPRINTIASFETIEQAKEMEKQQTEISDEEIEKSISYDSKDPYVEGYINGAKWYREQLKSRQ